MNLRISVVGLIVADMAASLAFYRRLGLSIPPEADKEPHVAVELPGGMQLTFDTEEVIRSFDEKWTRPESSYQMSMACACENPAAVDAAYAELTGAGYEGHLEPWDAFWGMRYASVRDPDGNPVDLYANLPSA
jgi:catechol 2,3-dioxygenase-like lactoylglutathione lyase family enzyme